MENVVITEHAGTKRDAISRFYQYGSGGVRVLDARKTIKRLYLSDPSSGIMTERDPRRQETILRRFIFDRYGMLEETFAFGQRPRTFRYENGGRQIAVREGGDYGSVGKIFTFENNGISETSWGRNGEIERVYQFDARGDAIIVRAGGWYGDVERTIEFTGMGASLFLEPEAFLQFLMFTEWSAKDRDEDINERVAQIRGAETTASGRSPYAYTGLRHTPADTGEAGGQEPVPQIPAVRKDGRPGSNPHGSSADTGINFIPDGDAPSQDTLRVQGLSSRRSSEIAFEERWQRSPDNERHLSAGKSAEIPLQERFESARYEKEHLLKGGSAEIPFEERFESERKEPGKLSKGRSAEIPYSERRGGGDR
jgi:hypothetical protein